MAILGHARRHTTFAAIITLAAAALLSPVALMSAWVCAESLALQEVIRRRQVAPKEAT